VAEFVEKQNSGEVAGGVLLIAQRRTLNVPAFSGYDWPLCVDARCAISEPRNAGAPRRHDSSAHIAPIGKLDRNLVRAAALQLGKLGPQSALGVVERLLVFGGETNGHRVPPAGMMCASASSTEMSASKERL